MTVWVASNRDTHDGARSAIDAARQVDGDHRGVLRIHRLDHGARRPFNRAVEAGAKERIDNDVGATKSGRIGGRDRPAPCLCRERCVTFEAVDLADQQHLQLVAARGQKPCRDKAIAAVIAGTRHHGDPAAGGASRRHRLGHRGAGFFHQRDAGHPAGDCKPIGLRHFGIGEEFDHVRPHHSECVVSRISGSSAAPAVDANVGSVPI